MLRKKRRQSIIDQHPLLPDLLLAHYPHDYDMAMGIAPVEPPESVRFEEGDNPEFQDVVETAAHSQEFSDQPDKEDNNQQPTEPVGAGEFHGGYGSASSLRMNMIRMLLHMRIR